MHQQLFRYTLVGLAQLLLDWLLTVLFSLFGMPIAIANILARGIATLLGFYLHANYTFARENSLIKQYSAASFRRHILWWCLASLLSTLLLKAVLALYGLHMAWLAKPLIEMLLACASFWISRHWIFPRHAAT